MASMEARPAGFPADFTAGTLRIRRAGEEARQTRLIVTPMLPRVALEYGQV